MRSADFATAGTHPWAVRTARRSRHWSWCVPGRAGRFGRQAAMLLDKGGMSPTKATRQTAPGRSVLYREI